MKNPYLYCYEGKTDAEGAITIGHEALLHLKNRVGSIEQLTKDINDGKYSDKSTKELNYQAIADELNNIANESKLNGEAGGKEHRDIARKGSRAKSFLKFMDELTKVLPKDKKSITGDYIKAKEKQHGETKTK